MVRHVLQMHIELDALCTCRTVAQTQQTDSPRHNQLRSLCRACADKCFADQGEDSLAEMGFADSKRWAAHPVAMSADCGSAMARVRGVPGSAWPMKKPCVDDLRGGVPLTDEQRQRIESMGTVR